MFANGLDQSAVDVYTEDRLYKSVGNGITFKKNLIDQEDIRTAVKALSDRVGARLRANGFRCSGVKVDIKNPQFQVISRQTQVDPATDLSSDIFRTALQLIEDHWRPKDPIRLITITGINLVKGETDEQLDFFSSATEEKESQRAVEEAMDHIREKFGDYAIVYGGIINNDLGISKGTDEENKL